MPINGIEDLATEGRTVLVRLDLNSPIDPASLTILDDKRFREIIPTLQALEDSKVVILTHQSRPGKRDFSTLSMHSERLATLLKKPVIYIDEIFGQSVREKVRSLKVGEVLMLENVRFNAEENLIMKPEEAVNTHFVKNLAKMGDFFINDAFGTAHRSQPSVVGLPMMMRSAAGLLMEKEVKNLSRVFTDAPRPVVMVLGGTKADDSIAVARNVLENGIADFVMVIGVVANLFLLAAGINLGKPSGQLISQLGYETLVLDAKDLLKDYSEKLLVPEFVAVRVDNKREEYPVSGIPEDSPVLDLGTESITKFSGILKKAGTVVFNGPAGVFEEPDFALGTYELLKAASHSKFSVCGGGHTAAVIEKLGIEGNFTHMSTGGGACIEFLTGKKLPAVEALERSKELFG